MELLQLDGYTVDYTDPQPGKNDSGSTAGQTAFVEVEDTHSDLLNLKYYF